MPVAPSKASPRRTAEDGGRGAAARSARSARSGRGSRAGARATARDDGQLISDEEREAAAGFERAHAAELEEEGRRHASIDAETERRRETEEEKQKRKIRGVAFDEERRHRGRHQRDDEDAEAANEAAQAAKEHGLVSAEGAGRYFQDLPPDRMGDLSLTNPGEIRRQLGPSVRFAQHAMLLAQNELEQGAGREQALAFLADLYVRLGDRAYANKALREFGPATGILDLYPLELMDHLLEFVPTFCLRISRGTFLTSSTPDGYRAKAGEVIHLTYDPGLRIRGFALKDGAQPGYLLEPGEPAGHYDLVFLSPGDFTVLMSAIGKDGHLHLETFECHIEPKDSTVVRLAGLEREREHDRREREVAKADEPQAKTKQDLTIHFPRRI